MLDSKLTEPSPTIGRRGLLGGALLGLGGLGLAACGSSSAPAVVPAAQQPTEASPSASATGRGGSGAAPDLAVFDELEKTYEARLGVYALDTDSGRVVHHRSDERFAMCSTYKFLAVGAVLSGAADRLDEQISYGQDDLVEFSPVTGQHTSMSLGELCAAALQQSDNTAGNLLLEYIGGPDEVTDLARALGDKVTQLDRIEPELNEARPDDEEDTSTPEMLGNDLYALLAGDRLSESARRQLKQWMIGSTTGDERIRAAVPRGWKVAGKTGSGSYGTANDVALVIPKGGRAPIVLSIMSSRETKGADYDDALIQEAAQAALDALRA